MLSWYVFHTMDMNERMDPKRDPIEVIMAHTGRRVTHAVDLASGDWQLFLDGHPASDWMSEPRFQAFLAGFASGLVEVLGPVED